MDLLELHALPARRREIFAAPDRHFGRDEGLKTYAALTPEAVLAVLQSPDWHASDFATIQRVISQRFGIDLSLSADVFAQIPLVNEGDRHRALRKELATVLAERLPAVTAMLPDLIARLLAPMRDADRMDLVGEVVLPLVAAINVELCGLAASREGTSVSRIFDMLLSPRSRIEIEANLKSMRAEAPDMDDERVMRALVFNVLGADTLAGALAATLHDVLAADSARALGEIDFPSEFTQTSVPYVGRRAVRDTETLGTRFEKDDLVRVYVVSFLENEANGDRSKVFGAGRHVCVGKRLSLMVWAELAAQLAQIPRRVAVTEYRLRAPDYLFVFPERLEIALS